MRLIRFFARFKKISVVITKFIFLSSFLAIFFASELLTGNKHIFVYLSFIALLALNLVIFILEIINTAKDKSKEKVSIIKSTTFIDICQIILALLVFLQIIFLGSTILKSAVYYFIPIYLIIIVFYLLSAVFASFKNESMQFIKIIILTGLLFFNWSLLLFNMHLNIYVHITFFIIIILNNILFLLEQLFNNKLIKEKEAV